MKHPISYGLMRAENSISLEASVGDQADYYYRLNDALQIMGDEYIKIIMITGETPDLNRDYELFANSRFYRKSYVRKGQPEFHFGGYEEELQRAQHAVHCGG